MFQASLTKEIVVRTKNDSGVLWDVARIVAERGVDILAVGAWVEAAVGVVRLVTNDNLRAKEALEKKGFVVQEEAAAAVLVPHKSGMLKHMTEPLMRESLDVRHLYGSATPGSGKCLLIFSCAQVERAVVSIDKLAESRESTV